MQYQGKFKNDRSQAELLYCFTHFEAWEKLLDG
jgi:hypothetical protein